MPEGSKQTENTRWRGKEKLDAALVGDDNVSWSSSTSSGHSITLSYDGIPDTVEIHNDLEKDGREKGKNKGSLIARLAKLNKPEAPALLLGSIAACFYGVVLPIYGLLISKSITIMFEPPHELRKDAKFWSLMCVGLGVFCLMVVPVQNYLFGVAGAKLIQRIRSLSFKKVVHQEISWFDDPKNSRSANFSLLCFCTNQEA